MERLAAALGSYLAAQLNLDNDQQEQICFGTFVLLQSALVLGFLIIFTMLIGTTSEALLIACVAASLRSISGGAHLHGPLRCTILSVCTFTGGSIITKLSAQALAILPKMLQVSIITLIACTAFFIYLVYAPVAAENRPLSIERRAKLRRTSTYLAATYVLIAIIASLADCKWVPSILIGLWFQGFTLTPAGNWFARSLDSLISICYIRR